MERITAAIEDYRLLDPSIDSGILLNAESWPVCLLRALPTLLMKLLERVSGISLERLQLIHVEIELHKASGHESAPFADAQMSRERSATHRLLKLSGTLATKGGLALKLCVTYAERGAKKYAKPQIDEEGLSPYAKKSLSAEDIKVFLKALGQDNRFFYDAEIARLNGLPNLFVPAPLLIFELISEAHKLMKKEARFYYFTFLEAIPLDHELSLSVAESENGLTLVMKAGPNEAVQLRSFDNRLSAEPALNQSI